MAEKKKIQAPFADNPSLNPNMSFANGGNMKTSFFNVWKKTEGNTANAVPQNYANDLVNGVNATHTGSNGVNAPEIPTPVTGNGGDTQNDLNGYAGYVADGGVEPPKVDGDAEPPKVDGGQENGLQGEVSGDGGTDTPTQVTNVGDGGNSGKVMTYAEYLFETKNRSYKTAEENYKSAIADANAGYMQNRATYGSNAESLGKAGLTGSGYADYLNSRAYTSQQERIRSAEKEMNTAKANADALYTEKLLEHDQGVSDDFAKLLLEANSGYYSGDQMKMLTENKGTFSDEQKTTLVRSAVENHDIVNQSDSGIIEAKLANGLITAEEADKQYKDTYIEKLDNGIGFDTSEVDKLYADKKITEGTYTLIKEKYNTLPVNDDLFANSEMPNGYMNIASAEYRLNELMNDKWLSQEKKDEIQKIYNGMYKIVKTPNAQIADRECSVVSPYKKGGDYDGKVKASSYSTKELKDSGNNFNLGLWTKDEDGNYKQEKISVQSGGKCDDAIVKELADKNGVKKGEFFGHLGKVYLKHGDGYIYEIQQRTNSYSGDFEKLRKLFFPNGYISVADKTNKSETTATTANVNTPNIG